MIYGRGNNSKSETPTRGVHSNAKITRLAGIAKKSDPFLKELQDVYDKENINPNLKEQRVKSQYVSEHRNQEGKSPRQRTSIVKPTRTYNIHNYNAVKPKENDVLSSSSKYHSTELPRGSHKASSRKTEHSDNITVGQFQEEYYNAKEEKKEKKMKVMLKDVNKKRKSVQENQREYMCRYQEETKESISRDLIGSLKKSLAKSNEKDRREESASKGMEWISDSHCFNHPEKKATHRLLQTEHHSYCQKCAVNLVTKGHKMQQLLLINPRLPTKSEEQKENRLQRLKDFLFDVDRLQPCFQHFQSSIETTRSLALSKFQNQKVVLDNYYSRIREEVQISHQKSLLNIKLFYDAVLEQLQKNDSILLQHYQDIKTIKDDIVPNINCIVQLERVTEQSFQDIISNYCKNLRIIQMNLKEISEYSYNSYYFNYQRNHGTLLNLRELIAPQICAMGMGDSQETQRNSREMSSGKKVQYFRMSFGKEMSESQQVRTL